MPGSVIAFSRQDSFERGGRQQSLFGDDLHAIGLPVRTDSFAISAVFA